MQSVHFLQVVKYKTLLLISTFRNQTWLLPFGSEGRVGGQDIAPGHFLTWTILCFSSLKVKLINELKVSCFQRGHKLYSCKNEISLRLFNAALEFCAVCAMHHVGTKQSVSINKMLKAIDRYFRDIFLNRFPFVLENHQPLYIDAEYSV